MAAPAIYYAAVNACCVCWVLQLLLLVADTVANSVNHLKTLYLNIDINILDQIRHTTKLVAVHECFTILCVNL